MGQSMSSLKNPKSNRGTTQPQHKQHIPGLPDDIAMECLLRVPFQFHSIMNSVSRNWRSLISDSSFYPHRRKSGFSEDLVSLVQPLPQPESPAGAADHLQSTAAVAVKEEKQEERENQKQIYSPPQFAVTIYNATYDTWQRTRPPSGIPMFCQCLALPFSGKILLLGGWDPATLEPVPDVHILDLAGGMRWRRGASMSVSRSFFACSAIGPSAIYVAGGHDGQKNALRSAEVYDVDRNEWRMLPEMEEERDECQGLAWEGDSRFWVVSGYGTESQGQFRPDGECFDPSTNSWSKVDGIWPFSNCSPRGNTVPVSANRNEWWWFLAGEQDQRQERWEIVSSIRVPDSINGTNPCVIDLGYSDHKNKRRFMVMSGNCRRSSSSSSSSSSSGGLRSSCENEGAFMLERDCSNGGHKWNPIHNPDGFSGFPFSASYLQM